MYSEQFSFMR